MAKHCCPSLITMDDHTDYCLSRDEEIERLRAALKLHVGKSGHVAWCHFSPHAFPPVDCAPRCKQTRAALAATSAQTPSAEGG